MTIAAPSNPYLVNWASARLLDFPCRGVSTGAVNIPVGTPMMPGVTAGTNVGILIPVTAGSNANMLGLLAEPHLYSSTPTPPGSLDATYQTSTQFFSVGALAGFGGTVLGSASVSGVGGPFPSHKLDLADTAVIVKMDYAISDASSFTVTTATSSTVIANSNFQASFDGAVIYFSAGTAIGEIGQVKSSIGSTSATLVSALTTNFVAGDTMVIINPLFYAAPTFLINSQTVATKIDTNPAAGTITAVNLANFIVQNGLINRLDPKIYHNAQKQNALAQLGFYSFLAMQQTAFHP